MNKFIVNNILIEKSEKDIKTGTPFEFSNGFNLICGNNEAGKSSIMNFLKESFFLEKGTETGKIYFEIDENGNNKKYRADIKSTAKRTTDRCVFFDEDNNSVNYSFVEEYIKQNYFKAGFTINLDDLNSLEQNKVDLVNVIKDPFNDKLSSSLKILTVANNDLIGVDFKPKIKIKDLLSKIKSLDLQIAELSQKEGEYNSVVEKINVLNLEIDRIKNVIKYLKLTLNLNDLKVHINSKKSELIIEEKAFNKKLYENNKELIEKNQDKLQKQLQNIKEQIAELMFEYGLSFDEEVIKNISIDNSKNIRIKELVEKNKELSASINAKLENQKIYKNELSHLSNVPTKQMTIEELKQLNSRLVEDNKTYNYLRDEIEKIDKKIIESNSNNNTKPMFIFIGIVVVLSIIASVIALMNKISYYYIFGLFTLVLIINNYFCWNFNKNKENLLEEKARKEEQKNKLFEALKQEIVKYYPNMDLNFITEIETIKYSLDTLIVKKSLLGELEQNLDELNKALEENQKEILSLKSEQFKNVSDNKYLEVVTLIASIKDEIKICDELKEENDFLEKENTQILDNFKTFVLENEVNIVNSIDFKENTKNLSVEIEKNTQTKNNIDNLKLQIEQKEVELNEITEKEADLLNNIDVVLEEDIEKQIEQLNKELEEKEEAKSEASAIKINLEAFQGVADKKVEKNILLSEYRQIVKKLMVNQFALNMVEVAKSNFNQTQPDLVNAQKYLSILTGGKYSKINLELQEISNDDNSLIKKWNILSRGTKEQLYLALRLGYASNYSNKNNKPSLPLIIDDAFVNFDVIRTKNALACLKEFAKTNQVLFFTCHTEQMQNLLKDLKIKDVNVIAI